MDLTNKINCFKIANSCCDTKNIVECDSFENGLNYSLKHITPKVAIDFTKWLRENYSDRDYHDGSLLDSNVWRKDYTHQEFTTEQLFEEFLKDYKYEN